jgi:hypothetical protein
MTFLEESIAVLSRTPATLDALLRGLPDEWTSATDGPETWSPYYVVGHLVHLEQTDWMRRVMRILEAGSLAKLAPVDRFGQLKKSSPKTLPELLDEFSTLRKASLEGLRARDLRPADLEHTGVHPEFGPVTLRQLIATWTAHDLGHLLQITRTMARRYKTEVGPWAAYLSVMR